MKKSFRLPFFILTFFVCLLFRHSSLFFVHSGFLFGIKERKNRDVFIDTHARTELSLLTGELLQREREREKKRSSWGRKRYALFRFDIQQKKRKSRKKTFALREMMRKAHFFLTYSFPFRGGHPFFKRMTMCRASRTTTTTTTTTTLCSSLQRERVRRGSPPKKEFFPFVLKSFLLKEKLTKSVRRSFYLLLSNNTLFHQTKTEAKNEQTRRG